MSNSDLADHLIEQYRSLISERYIYENLDSTFILPDSVTEQRVEEVRTYFLNQIYPSAENRRILNDAFDHLDDHFKNPTHLIRLVGDASGIMFKFGFQFPKALKAGMNSLKSFKAASEFEKGLLTEAQKKKLKTPISKKKFLELIAALPEKKVRGFVNDFDILLEALTDTKLLSKTVEIMKELVVQMKKHPEVYSKEDVNGMKMGLTILEEGYKLFKTMNKEEKQEMIETIIRAENSFLDDLYASK